MNLTQQLAQKKQQQHKHILMAHTVKYLHLMIIKLLGVDSCQLPHLIIQCKPEPDKTDRQTES